MRIAGYLEKLTRLACETHPDTIEVVPETGPAVPARITEINEYGCSFELQKERVPVQLQGGPVRVRWENFPEGIGGTVVRCNRETRFVAVRFGEMTGMQYVQLLEFIGERAVPVLKNCESRVS